jgi:hypothetical protein
VRTSTTCTRTPVLSSRSRRPVQDGGSSEAPRTPTGQRPGTQVMSPSGSTGTAIHAARQVYQRGTRVLLPVEEPAEGSSHVVRQRLRKSARGVPDDPSPAPLDSSAEGDGCRPPRRSAGSHGSSRRPADEPQPAPPHVGAGVGAPVRPTRSRRRGPAGGSPGAGICRLIRSADPHCRLASRRVHAPQRSGATATRHENAPGC